MTDTKPGCLPKFLRFLGPRTKPSNLTYETLEPDKLDEPDDLPYRLRDDFLSMAEASFYRVLKQVVSEHLLVCPKVSLDDIFFVAHPERHYTYLNKINRKHVDFLLCDPNSLKPVVGVELDDASHRRPERVERDEFVEQVFAAAKLPLLRFPVQAGYVPQEILQALRGVWKAGGGNAGAANGNVDAVSPGQTAQPSGIPLCPKCGVPMALRTAQRGEQAGRKFYGCPNYPRCREIINI